LSYECSMTLLLLIAVCFLAFSNGANDNFKGVASLFGSKTTSYGKAMAWATVTTFAGSIAAIYLAGGLLKKFSGKGLVPDALAQSEYFLLAVALGAGLTVLLATVTGFPISTTHALTGAMVGCGLVDAKGAVNWTVLGGSYFLPLLLSPVCAVVLAGGVYLVARSLRLKWGVTRESCVCVGAEPLTVPAMADGLALSQGAVLPVAGVGKEAACLERYVGSFLGVNGQQVVDVVHFLSAGVVSFARGLNDTPKMAGLLYVLPVLGGNKSLAAVAVAIAVGGVLGARRVALTMSQKITGMNHGQGLCANFATGLLVLLASIKGLPVSTTHVSVGALFGIGLINKEADARVMRNILLSWLITLPCAAVLGALVCLLCGKLGG
jgi:inorganic phosphate transporter, PiT family